MRELRRTARVTGLLYLLLAVAGGVGFIFARSALDGGDATMTNLVERREVARVGLAAELTVVLSQLLVALAFYRLFRHVSRFAGAALVGFAFLGAMSVLVAVATLAAAVDVAGRGTPDDGVTAEIVRALFDVSNRAWDVGGLLFGLWLLPMAYLAYVSGYMPRALGILLAAGGVGYVISTYLAVSWPDGPGWLPGGLTAVATVGEVWMIAHLLSVGVLGSARVPDEADQGRVAPT